MATSRRAYIDWLRGVAVLCMIEWHVLDSWTVRDGRDTLAWTVVQTIGGFAAPLFLFLAGVAVPMAIASHERRGRTASDAGWRVQKRGWQVFGLAHLFRFQSFVLNPKAQWPDVLAPDILNILGLGLAGAAALASRARTVAGLGWWLLLPAMAIVLLTPASRIWEWPALLHPRLEAYIRPLPNTAGFSFFPWAAFVPVGAFIGALILRANSHDERAEIGMLKRIAIAGALAVVAGVLLSPFLARTGWMMLALGGAWWAVGRQPARWVAPMLLLGQTSLFVYWVHVELAYGVWSYPVHHALPLAGSLAGMVVVVWLMYKAAIWWTSRRTLAQSVAEWRQ